MAYKFDKAVLPKTTNKFYLDPSDPRLRLSVTGLFIPAGIFDELGKPERVLIYVDEKNKAFKLENADIGYSVRLVQLIGGEVYYKSFRSVASKPERYKRIFKTLPLGLYRPIGGGVFEFESPAKKTKE